MRARSISRRRRRPNRQASASSRRLLLVKVELERRHGAPLASTLVICVARAGAAGAVALRQRCAQRTAGARDRVRGQRIYLRGQGPREEQEASTSKGSLEHPVIAFCDRLMGVHSLDELGEAGGAPPCHAAWGIPESLLQYTGLAVRGQHGWGCSCRLGLGPGGAHTGAWTAQFSRDHDYLEVNACN